MIYKELVILATNLAIEGVLEMLTADFVMTLYVKPVKDFML